MNDYTLRDYLDAKGILSGVVIAIILISVSFSVAPYVLSDDDPPFSLGDSWDISSPSKASSSMNNHVGNLLFLRVSVHKVVNTDPVWETTNENKFYKGISVFTLSKELPSISEGMLISPDDAIWEMGSWKLSYDTTFTINNLVLDVDGDLIKSQLQTSLSKDLEGLNSLDNITQNYNEEIKSAEDIENVIYWEIDHAYDDGTALSIKVFGDSIFLQLYTLVGLLVTEGYYSIFSDLTQEFKPSYKGKTGAIPFRSYENTINDLLENIIDGN